MFLISTRNFPPDIGGMQNLMEGLSNALLNHGPVQVFADSFEESENYDQNSKLNIQRISGFKIFKKYRKANLVKDFIKNNQLRAIFFDLIIFEKYFKIYPVSIEIALKYTENSSAIVDFPDPALPSIITFKGIVKILKLLFFLISFKSIVIFSFSKLKIFFGATIPPFFI